MPADRRTIVTNHEALACFAERYDVHVVGTIIPGMSTGAEPSAQDMEQLTAVVRREGVTTIFAESTAPRQLAETLAGEVGGMSTSSSCSPGRWVAMTGRRRMLTCS